MHLADVVLQVKGRGKVGLAVVPGTNQHGLMGSVDPFVPPQSVRFLKHLLARLACERGCNTVSKCGKLKQTFGIDFRTFVL